MFFYSRVLVLSSLLRFFRHNGQKPGCYCADVASLEFFRVPDLAVARRRRGGRLRLCPAPLAILSRCLAPLPRLQNTKKLRKTTHFFRHKPGRYRVDVASLIFFFRIPGGRLRLCPAPVAVLSRCLALLSRLQNTKDFGKQRIFFDTNPAVVAPTWRLSVFFSHSRPGDCPAPTWRPPPAVYGFCDHLELLPCAPALHISKH